MVERTALVKRNNEFLPLKDRLAVQYAISLGDFAFVQRVFLKAHAKLLSIPKWIFTDCGSNYSSAEINQKEWRVRWELKH